MWASKEFVAACKSLADSGVRLDFKIGASVARGFADVGSEQFIVLPGQKILSAYTGKISDFPKQDEHYFFALPSVDTMVELIQQKSFDVESLVFEGQREWVLSLRSAHVGQVMVLRHVELPCVFAIALKAVS